MSGYWVQVSEPGHPARVVTIDAEVEVGRDCDGIVIEDPTASRRHLKLDPTAIGLVVEDLHSANGTYIDDERITEPMIVQAGNVVRLGETEMIVFQGHKTEQRTTDAPAAVSVEGHRISAEARKLTQASQKMHRPGQAGRPPSERPTRSSPPPERPGLA